MVMIKINADDVKFACDGIIDDVNNDDNVDDILDMVCYCADTSYPMIIVDEKTFKKLRKYL